MTHPRQRTRATPFLPRRHGLFLLLCLSAAPLGLVLPWHAALMGGFDIAALTFIASLPGLFRADPHGMRQHARDNDARRGLMLVLTAVVMLVILLAVTIELRQAGGMDVGSIVLIVLTLALAWLFSNLVYTLHYAHLFYMGDSHDKDSGGVDFPGCKTPSYWDFTYFSFTLGMTFQTSDVTITSTQLRQIVTLHSLAAFVFNLGIVAFTINVLGS